MRQHSAPQQPFRGRKTEPIVLRGALRVKGDKVRFASKAAGSAWPLGRREPSVGGRIVITLPRSGASDSLHTMSFVRLRKYHIFAERTPGAAVKPRAVFCIGGNGDVTAACTRSAAVNTRLLVVHCSAVDERPRAHHASLTVALPAIRSHSADARFAFHQVTTATVVHDRPRTASVTRLTVREIQSAV